MILTPAPLQKPAAKAVVLPTLRGAMPATARSGVALRPVLQTARVPQQLCLDLQPRLR
jgi:hypothetical protein